MRGHHTGGLGVQQEQELFLNKTQNELYLWVEKQHPTLNLSCCRMGRGERGILTTERPLHSLVMKTSETRAAGRLGLWVSSRWPRQA